MLAPLSKPLLDEQDLKLVHVLDTGGLLGVILEAVLKRSATIPKASPYLVIVVDSIVDEVKWLVDGRLALWCHIALRGL